MSPFYRDIGIWFWGENMGHIDFKVAECYGALYKRAGWSWEGLGKCEFRAENKGSRLAGRCGLGCRSTFESFASPNVGSR